MEEISSAISNKYAILIDSENVSAKYIESIFDELSRLGSITVRKIYGDWSKNNNGWDKDCLLSYSIQPVQQFSYTAGKNSTDSAMIIDAMDLLYTSNIDGFCLVTSDSDFTRLASRLREAGKQVIGMGERKTPKAFVSACTSFKILDSLVTEDLNKPASKNAMLEAAAEKGIVIAAGWWGKIKTTVQMIMVGFLIADLKVFYIFDQVLIYLALALTLISLGDYLYHNREVLKD